MAVVVGIIGFVLGFGACVLLKLKPIPLAVVVSGFCMNEVGLAIFPSKGFTPESFN